METKFVENVIVNVIVIGNVINGSVKLSQLKYKLGSQVMGGQQLRGLRG